MHPQTYTAPVSSEMKLFVPKCQFAVSIEYFFVLHLDKPLNQWLVTTTIEGERGDSPNSILLAGPSGETSDFFCTFPNKY